MGYKMAARPAVGGNAAAKSPKRAEEDLARFLSPFSFQSVCACCARVSGLRAKNSKEFSEELARSGLDSLTEFRPHMIRFVVYEAAQACSEDDLNGKEMAANDLLRALRLAEHVPASSIEVESRRDVLFSMMALMQNQIHDTVGYSYMGREIFLALDVVRRALSVGLDIDRRFEEFYGLRYRELAAGCTWLWNRLLRTGEEGFLFRRHQEQTSDLWFEPERALDVVSADRSKIVAWQRERVVEGYEPFSLSALKEYPVVVHSDGLVSVPVANDLLDRPFRGLFYDLSPKLDKTERGIFGDVSGAAYEALVEETLKACCGSKSVFRAEDVIERREGEKVCDFICVEPGHLTFVEAKSARPLMRTEITKDPVALREYVLKRGSIADAVEQIAISIKTTHKAIQEGRARIPKRRRMLGLIVTPGERVGINSAIVRGMIRDRLRETDGKGFEKYLIADDLGLDHLARTLSTRPGLGRLLWALMRDSAHKFDDVHTQLDYGDFGQHPLQAKFDESLEALFMEP